jgi:hypothetical protein
VKQTRFVHEFVEFLPEQLAEGVLYISMNYAVASHKCACGCGCDVVTPISPTDWQLRFDGVAVSLEPSIGNWSFPCRSHYFLDGGTVRWAGDMPQSAIEYGRAKNRLAKESYFLSRVVPEPLSVAPPQPMETQPRVAAETDVVIRPWWIRLPALFKKRR